MKQREKIALLRKARKQIQALDNKRYQVYGRVCAKFGAGDDNDYLFDYLFNDFGDVRKLAKTI